MLYDPKWATKADPLTLESLIAWLERQPADEAYDYLCAGHCLLARYFTDIGFPHVHMFGDGFWSGRRRCPGNVGWDEVKHLPEGHRLPDGWNRIAQGYGGGPGRTFGDALRRALASL